MNDFLFRVEETGQLEALRGICTEFEQREDVAGLLVLTCDANGYSPDSLDPLLRARSLPLIGAVFPELLIGNKRIIYGSIVIGLKSSVRTFNIAGLSDEAADYDELISQAMPELGSARTALVFVDGLSRRISSLLDGLFDNFGLEVNYLGGGAGSLSLERKPCLLTNQGMLEDAALIALFDQASGVGVQHGWNPLADSFKATECDQNRIVSLDWQPAYEVYKRIVETQPGVILDPDNFYATAQSFPFGLRKLDAEMVVRDPISVGNNGEIVCVGEVPVNSYLHVLTSDVPTLVDAASQVLPIALRRYPGSAANAPALLFDCISRALFMGARFQEELDVFDQSERTIIGALTIGEIANNGRSYLELFNKTAVVGVIDL